MAPRNGKATLKKEGPESAMPNTDALSAAGRKRKVDWATIDDEAPFVGFKLEAVKTKTPKKSAQAQKKQKTGGSANGKSESYQHAPMDADIVQKNPFPESELSETHFAVQPTAEWESTQRYRKFTISEAEFEVNQLIFVDSEGTDEHMIGKVLEVRAGDQAHVYLRVYWLYRPEDLPGGRQPHHGDSELIASNHMDIIEALTVADKAEVIHWDEDPDKSAWPLKEQLFWRQTYDLGKPAAQRLSKLRPFCVDKAPCNPDEPLINCPSCSGWLHAHCLEDQAVRDVDDQNKILAKGRSAKAKKKGPRKSSSGATFVAHLTTQDSGKTIITVTDKRSGQNNRRWNVDINCLICKKLIEQADDDVPPEEATGEEVGIKTTEGAVMSPAEVATEYGDEQDSVVGNEDDIDGTTELDTSDTAAREPADKAVSNGESTDDPPSA